jgi:hypothetical protein
MRPSSNPSLATGILQATQAVPNVSSLLLNELKVSLPVRYPHNQEQNVLRSSTALKKAINFFTLDTVGRRRVLAGSMIALIATPTMFLPPRSSAQNFGRTVSAPLSAPSEPFVIHQAQTFTAIAVGLVAPVSAAISSLAPDRPEGLAAARIPSFGERFLSSIVLLIALIKPSTSTITSATKMD